MFRKGSVLIWSRPPSKNQAAAEGRQDKDHRTKGTPHGSGGERKERCPAKSAEYQTGAVDRQLTPECVDEGPNEEGESPQCPAAPKEVATGDGPAPVRSEEGSKSVPVRSEEGSGCAIQQQKKPKRTLLTLHEDIVSNKFWEKHPNVLV